MVERQPPTARTTVPAFLEPVNYEYRAAVALLFALMYCLPIIAGVVAILTARSVLRAPIALSNTARISSIVSIVLGSGNIIMWSINLGIRARYWYAGHSV